MEDKLLQPATHQTVDDLLGAARSSLQRVTPADAYERAQRGALLIDLRILEQRQANGVIPDSVVISLNHLEWRLDPSSASRLPQVTDHEIDIVLLCDEGYCSSLAAARLHELGLHRATDVIGGFQAWRADGLPVIEPT
jgi:rhodanese-related sulfurtransferase